MVVGRVPYAFASLLAHLFVFSFFFLIAKGAFMIPLATPMLLGVAMIAPVLKILVTLIFSSRL